MNSQHENNVADFATIDDIIAYYSNEDHADQANRESDREDHKDKEC